MPLKNEPSPQPSTARTEAPRAAPILPLVIIGVLIGGYTLLSHYSYASPNAKGLGAGLSVGPIVLIGLVLAWRWAHKLVAGLITIVIAALLYLYWPFLKDHYQWSDLVQQAGAYVIVAFGFGRSLLPGRVPACTQVTAQLHGPLSPPEVAYTRRATIVWFGFYALLAAAIVILFFTTSEHTWSLFVDFGSFGLMGLLFAADHALRRLVLPRRPGGGMIAALLHAVSGPRR
ncbi:MAG: hypothetical protein ABSF94_11105 [Steroidobacteraceae bacterium]